MPRDNVTFNPSIFYLKYWTSPNPTARLSISSCATVQGVLLSEARIPQDNRRSMEELYRTMHSSIIEHLPVAFLPSADPDIYAVALAASEARIDLSRSKSTFVDEAEACKPYLNKRVSWACIDKYSICRSLAAMQFSYRYRLKVCLRT